MKNQSPRSISVRLCALILAIVVVLPNPAYALRQIAQVEAKGSGLEELERKLSSVPPFLQELQVIPVETIQDVSTRQDQRLFFILQKADLAGIRRLLNSRSREYVIYAFVADGIPYLLVKVGQKDQADTIEGLLSHAVKQNGIKLSRRVTIHNHDRGRAYPSWQDFINDSGSYYGRKTASQDFVYSRSGRLLEFGNHRRMKGTDTSSVRFRMWANEKKTPETMWIPRRVTRTIPDPNSVDLLNDHFTSSIRRKLIVRSELQDDKGHWIRWDRAVNLQSLLTGIGVLPPATAGQEEWSIPFEVWPEMGTRALEIVSSGIVEQLAGKLGKSPLFATTSPLQLEYLPGSNNLLTVIRRGGNPSVRIGLDSPVDNVVDEAKRNAKAQQSSYSGTLQVRIKRIGDDAVLEISDNVLGVDRDTLPQLFKEKIRRKTTLANDWIGGVGGSVLDGKYGHELMKEFGGAIEINSRHAEAGAWLVRYDAQTGEVSMTPGERDQVGVDARWIFPKLFSNAGQEEFPVPGKKQPAGDDSARARAITLLMEAHPFPETLDPLLQQFLLGNLSGSDAIDQWIESQNIPRDQVAQRLFLVWMLARYPMMDGEGATQLLRLRVGVPFSIFIELDSNQWKRYGITRIRRLYEEARAAALQLEIVRESPLAHALHASVRQIREALEQDGDLDVATLELRRQFREQFFTSKREIFFSVFSLLAAPGENQLSPELLTRYAQWLLEDSAYDIRDPEPWAIPDFLLEPKIQSLLSERFTEPIPEGVLEAVLVGGEDESDTVVALDNLAAVSMNALSQAVNSLLPLDDASASQAYGILVGNLSGHAWYLFGMMRKEPSNIKTFWNPKPSDAGQEECGEVVIDQHQKPISAVVISPDGKIIASGDVKGRLVIKQVEGGASPIIVDTGNGITDLAFDASGGKIAAGHADGAIAFYDPQTGEPFPTAVAQPLQLGAWIWNLAFHREGHIAIAATDSDGRIQSIQIKTDDVEHPDDVERLFGSLGKFSIRTNFVQMAVAFLEEGRVARFAISGNGSEGSEVIVLDESPTPREIDRFKIPGGIIQALAIDPTGQHLVVSNLEDDADKNWIQLRNINTHSSTTLQGVHRQRANAMAFSPDGKMLVSAGKDGQLVFWEVPSGRVIKTVSLDPFEGREPPSPKSGAPYTSSVLLHDVVFTPNGHSVLVAVEDQTIKQQTVRRFSVPAAGQEEDLPLDIRQWDISRAEVNGKTIKPMLDLVKLPPEGLRLPHGAIPIEGVYIHLGVGMVLLSPKTDPWWSHLLLWRSASSSLQVRHGMARSDKGKVLRQGGIPLLLGRNPETAGAKYPEPFEPYVVSADGASKAHLLIRLDANGDVVLKDLNSKNGTWIDRKAAEQLRYSSLAMALLIAEQTEPEPRPDLFKSRGVSLNSLLAIAREQGIDAYEIFTNPDRKNPAIFATNLPGNPATLPDPVTGLEREMRRIFGKQAYQRMYYLRIGPKEKHDGIWAEILPVAGQATEIPLYLRATFRDGELVDNPRPDRILASADEVADLLRSDVEILGLTNGLVLGNIPVRPGSGGWARFSMLDEDFSTSIENEELASGTDQRLFVVIDNAHQTVAAAYDQNGIRVYSAFDWKYAESVGAADMDAGGVAEILRRAYAAHGAGEMRLLVPVRINTGIVYEEPRQMFPPESLESLLIENDDRSSLSLAGLLSGRFPLAEQRFRVWRSIPDSAGVSTYKIEPIKLGGVSAGQEESWDQRVEAYYQGATVAVLGGRGFVGGRYLNQLLDRWGGTVGKVRALTTQDPQAIRSQVIGLPGAPKLEISQGNHIQLGDVRQLIKGAKVVIDTAGLAWQHLPGGKAASVRDELLQNSMSAALIGFALEKDQRLVWTSSNASDYMLARLQNPYAQALTIEIDHRAKNYVEWVRLLGDRVPTQDELTNFITEDLKRLPAHIYAKGPNDPEEVAYAEAFSYAYSKLLGQRILEIIAREDGKDIRVLKISDVYGPGQGLGPEYWDPASLNKQAARRPQLFMAVYEAIATGLYRPWELDRPSAGFGKGLPAQQTIYNDFAAPTYVDDVVRMMHRAAAADLSKGKVVLSVSTPWIPNTELVQTIADVVDVQKRSGQPIAFVPGKELLRKKPLLAGNNLELLGMQDSLTPLRDGITQHLAWWRTQQSGQEEVQTVDQLFDRFPELLVGHPADNPQLEPDWDEPSLRDLWQRLFAFQRQQQTGITPSYVAGVLQQVQDAEQQLAGIFPWFPNPAYDFYDLRYENSLYIARTRRLSVEGGVKGFSIEFSNPAVTMDLSKFSNIMIPFITWHELAELVKGEDSDFMEQRARAAETEVPGAIERVSLQYVIHGFPGHRYFEAPFLAAEHVNQDGVVPIWLAGNGVGDVLADTLAVKMAEQVSPEVLQKVAQGFAYLAHNEMRDVESFIDQITTRSLPLMQQEQLNTRLIPYMLNSLARHEAFGIYAAERGFQVEWRLPAVQAQRERFLRFLETNPGGVVWVDYWPAAYQTVLDDNMRILRETRLKSGLEEGGNQSGITRRSFLTRTAGGTISAFVLPSLPMIEGGVDRNLAKSITVSRDLWHGVLASASYDRTRFFPKVSTDIVQLPELREKGFVELSPKQINALGYNPKLKGFLIRDSASVTDAGHFVVAEQGLTNAAAENLYPWVYAGEGLNDVIDYAKGAEAQIGDLMLIKPAKEISVESVTALLRERGFPDSKAPRVAIGDESIVSVLPPVAFQLLAVQSSLPPVVFLNTAVRLTDEAGQTYTLILMA